MHIALCHSMIFTEKALEIKAELEKMGHKVSISSFAQKYVGIESEKEREDLTVYHKNETDAVRMYWEEVKKADAILVVNYDRRGIKNYIGGNTFWEIGFAHVLHKKIFLLNPVPEVDIYKSEIEATKPVIINGDLTKIQ